MNRRVCLSVLAGAVAAPAVAWAQSPDAPRFRWAQGQVLTYRCLQKTTATDLSGEEKAEKSEAVSTLELVKRWEVTAVDAAGVATLQLSLTALKTSTVTPDGTAMTFDSANPGASNVENRDELAKYVGGPLAVLRLDGRGRVVEVKQSGYGPASRYESEPPMRLTLPEGPLAAGSAWDREYTMTLEPPQGVGEKFPAVQHYKFKGMAGTLAVVSVATEVRPPADAKPDQVIPLLPMQPEGDVWFDTATGRLKAARLKVVKEVKEHRGPGSKYTFESVYSEDLVGN